MPSRLSRAGPAEQQGREGLADPRMPPPAATPRASLDKQAVSLRLRLLLLYSGPDFFTPVPGVATPSFVRRPRKSAATRIPLARTQSWTEDKIAPVPLWEQGYGANLECHAPTMQSPILGTKSDGRRTTCALRIDIVVPSTDGIRELTEFCRGHRHVFLMLSRNQGAATVSARRTCPRRCVYEYSVRCFVKSHLHPVWQGPNPGTGVLQPSESWGSEQVSEVEFWWRFVVPRASPERAEPRAVRKREILRRPLNRHPAGRLARSRRVGNEIWLASARPCPTFS